VLKEQRTRCGGGDAETELSPPPPKANQNMKSQTTSEYTFVLNTLRASGAMM
jgi:hypothetical protein